MSHCLVLCVFLAVFSAAANGSVIGANVAKDETLKCDYGYTLWNTKCYKYLSTPTTYTKALRNCKAEFANLVSIHDEHTNDYIANTHPNSTIGIMYWGGCTFTWSDNTSVDYKNLADDFLKYADYLGNCAFIDEDGKWHNMDCEIENERPYVCQKAPTAAPNTDCPTASPLLMDAGQITNPGYPLPSYFSSSQTCQYKLAVKNNHLVQLVFSELSLTSTGYISIYEGLSVTGTPLKTIPYNNAPASLINETITTAKSNRMLVQFSASSNYPQKWSALWKSVEKGSKTSELKVDGPLHDSTNHTVFHPKLVRKENSLTSKL